MKIKFTEDRIIEAQGEIVSHFKAGEVYELEAASAKRWLRRNVATEVQGSVKPKATKSTAKAAAPKKRGRPRKVVDTPVAPKPDDSDISGRAESDAGTSEPDKAPGDDSDK